MTVRAAMLTGRAKRCSRESSATVDAAYASCARQDDRFGLVRSSLPLIPAKAPYWHDQHLGQR